MIRYHTYHVIIVGTLGKKIEQKECFEALEIEGKPGMSNSYFKIINVCPSTMDADNHPSLFDQTSRQRNLLRSGRKSTIGLI